VTVRAYHFVGRRLRDGQPVPEDGVKLVFHGEPILCKQGLHASRHPSDALKYAPGPTLCLVDVSGQIVEDEDKLVGTERTIIRRIDATELLRYFARMLAVSALDHWEDNPPDVVLDWLMTGDESLRSVARAAARSVADSAAWAARSVAESAAWAARSAADSAAWAAARDFFDELVKESLG